MRSLNDHGTGLTSPPAEGGRGLPLLGDAVLVAFTGALAPLLGSQGAAGPGASPPRRGLRGKDKRAKLVGARSPA